MNEFEKRMLELLIKSYNETIKSEGTDFLYEELDSTELKQLVEEYME